MSRSPHEDGPQPLRRSGIARRARWRRKPAEEVGRCEKAGSRRCPARMLAELLPAPAPRMARAVPALMLSPSHRSTPMIVLSARTLSPTRTLSTAPRGTMKVRPRAEPDQPVPLTRLDLVNPGRTRHTIRREATPRSASPPRARCSSRATVQRSFSSRLVPVRGEKRPSATGRPARAPPRVTVDVHVEGDRNMDTRTAAHPAVVHIHHAHHAPVGRARTAPPPRAAPLRIAKEARQPARRARRAPPPTTPDGAQDTRGRAAGTIKRQPSTATGMRTALSRPAINPGGLIQEIILRSRAPTSSMGCSASRRRWARKPARWAWFSRPFARRTGPTGNLPEDLLHLGLGLLADDRGPRV